VSQPNSELNHFVVVAARLGAHANTEKPRDTRFSSRKKPTDKGTRPKVHTGKIQPTSQEGKQPTESQDLGCCSAQDKKEPTQRKDSIHLAIDP